MPRAARLDELSPAERSSLDQEIVRRNFKDMAGLSDWLKEMGYEIGPSVVHRQALKVKRRMEAVKASTDAARLIAEAAPDDADLRSAAVISLVQSELFELLLNLQEADETDDPMGRVELMAKAAKGVADLSRASVSQKKWQREIGAKLTALETAAKSGARKLDADTLAAVRREVYGLQ